MSSISRFNVVDAIDGAGKSMLGLAENITNFLHWHLIVKSFFANQIEPRLRDEVFSFETVRKWQWNIFACDGAVYTHFLYMFQE